MVVLVTGSSKGIGASCIRKFAQEGYDVVINYNNSFTEATALEQEIKNVKTLKIKCDITNPQEVKAMVDQIMNEFGRIDVLINNAALEITGDLYEKSSDDFKKVLDVNLVGALNVSKEVSKHMKEGCIINISSNNATNCYDPSTLEYNASKAGLISLTHDLARYLAPFIRVNAIAPGWILSESVQSLNDSLNGELEKEESKKILVNRFGTPDEVADLVYFLSKNKYINDEVIRIDGGLK